MAEFKLEYLLLGYVPNVLRKRGIEIAVCLHECEDKADKFAGVRFLEKWKAAQDIDPQADTEVLQALEREIRSQWPSIDGRQSLIRLWEDSFSNTIQLSERKVCISQDPVQTLNDLERDYLKPIQYEHESRLPAGNGVGYIRSQMHSAFAQQGILPLMLTDIAPVRQRAGDRLKFDFGYSIGSDLKLLQAVSMHSRLDAAVTLAARYPKIASDFANEKGVKTWLTAVVEDDADRNRDEVGFALGMLEESGIEVALVKDMPRIAEGIKWELRA
ncbi:MAG TPA: DUF3037 domain-containing protein [Terriglobales bacterium]|nr:DUF3037 domain-containing protein [Terriglobales bacterium]